MEIDSNADEPNVDKTAMEVDASTDKTEPSLIEQVTGPNNDQAGTSAAANEDANVDDVLAPGLGELPAFPSATSARHSNVILGLKRRLLRVINATKLPINQFAWNPMRQRFH